QEQNRIFHPSTKRRIILSTNVAETSLTVPGIRYVIDAGTARISRYSYRSKIQRLPVEKISQASANQRAGRCWRLSAGICIRLYSEEDYLSRSPFCEAEILRTNLAAVILNMESLRLGHVEQFPFLEPPDKRLINDGYKLLFELGAINTRQQLTKLGKQLARLPLDPRLGRMLLAAADEGALRELLIIVAALSIQDPRDRPLDKQQAADEKHRHFRDPKSDFMAYINIWHAWQQQRQKSSHNQQRRWCREQFLAYMRMREWQDTHRQIEQTINELKLRINEQPADYDAIHRSLLCGLLGQIGFKDDAQCYSGARNRKFFLFPGSGLFQKRSHRQQKQESSQNSDKAHEKKERRATAPKWLMAAELVETSKLYARTAAEISPQWVEEKATHLLKRSYSEPRWEKNAGQVRAFEKTTLYGLVINPQRTINYGPIAPQEAREIFIRGALVNGELRNPPKFLQQNLELIGELMALEAKSRRRDILVDEQVLYQFYDQRIPAEIYNVPLFEQWRKQAEKREADILLLQRNDLMQHDADHITQDRFPDTLTVNGVSYPLEYHFDPSHQHDGVTLITPLPLLSRLQPAHCDWLVPGLLHEKVVALIKSLPKQLRRNFVPAPDFADACLDALTPYQQLLAPSIAAHLRKITGITVPEEAWQTQPLDSHLLMNIRVIDSAGATIDEGRNLQQLQAQVDAVASRCIDEAIEQNPQQSLEQKTVSEWSFDELPAAREVTVHGVALTIYLALQREGSRVALRAFDSHDKALVAQRHGVRQLIINRLPKTATSMRGAIDTLALYGVGLDSADNLKRDLLSAAINDLDGDTVATNREQFQQLQNDIQMALPKKLVALCKLCEPILKSHQQLRKRLKKPRMQWLDSISDIHAQLDQLIYPHFIERTPMLWLKQFPRYINAINKRLDKLEQEPRRDRSQRLEFAPLWDAYCTRAENPHHHSAALQQYRWMLEEFRVSLYAQELGTELPVSHKRLTRYWKKEVLQQT
ncbi:MAG: ATP-dependent RNA helicase HrpA, partial [Gammaproteobacteria bacterium]|nr:ATP-dependent RNA helicase HrpA [Gammaproteobacteria bacterium]